MVIKTDISSSGIWSNEQFHVLDGIYGDTRSSHIARHAFVIRIIAPVRGQIKGYRKSFLSGSDISSVKGVAFPGRGKTGILANRPGAAHVHGGVGTT